MQTNVELRQWTTNASLNRWIEEIKTLCRPARVHLCDGSQKEYDALCEELVKKKTFVRLNPEKRPNSFWCRSTQDDVARVEEATYICSISRDDAGPTNNWKDPVEMHAILDKLFEGCMQGRTMYVIPYCMGPLDSPLSRVGVEITDSAYVVCSMYIMTRIGKKALTVLGNGPFIPCVHSLGLAVLIKNTLFIFLKKEAFGLLEAATAAMRFSAKKDLLCGLPLSWPAKKAGLLSTC
jgi:phosphoenolpyruvate carboxykinase (GTP)